MFRIGISPDWELYTKYEDLFNDVLPPVCRYFPEYVLMHEKMYDIDLHALLVCIVYSSYRSHVCFNSTVHPFTDDERVAGDDELGRIADDFLERAKAGGAKAVRTSYITVSHGGDTPVVYCHNNFYLNKYYRYEKSIAQFISNHSVNEEAYSPELYEESAAVLFGNAVWNQGQRAAARTALQKKFSVIAGGPGTGKTTTVCKVLLMRIQQARRADKELSIVMLAPTGKAAARLQESVQAGVHSLLKDPALSDELRECAEHIPQEAGTVHRLLYGSRHTQTLPCDLFIIDESSMIDINNFYALISRCADTASMILLGDTYQLASVEAGSVLSDISGAARPRSSAFCATITHSFRFDPQGGIGKAARLLSESRGEELYDFITSDDPGIRFIDTGGVHSSRVSSVLVQAFSAVFGSFEEYARYTARTDPAESIALFHRCAVLCALRKGPYGVAGINDTIEQLLFSRGYIACGSRLYNHMPLLVTKNSYLLDLYNGDTGILRYSDEMLKLYLKRDSDKSLRMINPVMLESYEKSYAMTIHKSQGSEFDSVIIVLPEKPLPILSRELLYTAVTRARKRVVIIGSKASIISAAGRQTRRMSGLTAMLDAAQEPG